MEEIRLPGPTDRIVVVGRTGSGKTVAALWHLSNSDFTERPWVILDYKNEDLINGIERAQQIDYDELPAEPGIYILKILPGDREKLNQWFKDVWEEENIGIFVDEGYMVDPQDEWFNACLTQGRSKHIPMIVLSQRPVWLSRFVFSEANFFQVFDLTHSKDRDKVREYIREPDGEHPLEEPLEDFHSFYYDVGRRRLETLSPVPDSAELLVIIDGRLAELDGVPAEADRPRRRAI